MPSKDNKSESTSEVETDKPSMFQQILSELKAINSKIDTIEQKVSEIEESLDYHVLKIDELKTDFLLLGAIPFRLTKGSGV